MKFYLTIGSIIALGLVAAGVIAYIGLHGPIMRATQPRPPECGVGEMSYIEHYPAAGELVKKVLCWCERGKRECSSIDSMGKLR